jgi:uridine kinase
VEGEEIAALCLARPARAGTTRVLAVDGPSGSGKSTLAAALVGPLARRASVAVVHMDDLYPGWDGLAEAVPLVTGQVLAPMAQGRPAGYRRWDWEAHRWDGHVAVPGADVLVLEGVGCGARACAPHLSVLVWVEAADAVRRERGVARDGEAYRPHWERWARQEQEHFRVEGTRERADVVVRT